MTIKKIYETATLRHNNKFWKGQVIQDRKEIYKQTETWRLLTDGKESKHLFSEPYRVVGKNSGRSNETTAQEQAIAEITSMMNGKRDKGYTKLGEKSTILPLPMLAHKFGDRKHNITYPAYVQPKYNGMRMLYDGKRAWSRGGKLISPDVIEHLKFDTRGHIMDGELMLPEMPVLQETMKAAKKYRKGISDKLVYVVYDLVDPKSTFSERDKKVRDITWNFANSNIIRAPTYSVRDDLDVMQFHKQFIVEGYEGTMIRNADGLYKINKRSHDLLKLKNFQDSEFRIADVIDGGGKDTGHAIFVCETKKGIKFNCRPEGTMEYRADVFKNRKKYIGKWLTIRYAELTNDGVPQFPVGVDTRDDGDF